MCAKHRGGQARRLVKKFHYFDYNDLNSKMLHLIIQTTLCNFVYTIYLPEEAGETGSVLDDIISRITGQAGPPIHDPSTTIFHKRAPNTFLLFLSFWTILLQPCFEELVNEENKREWENEREQRGRRWGEWTVERQLVFTMYLWRYGSL